MDRLTLNKKVSDMSMTELAHNSCYAKDGEAFYRDFDCEISARDLARKLYKFYSDIKLSDDNDDFDEEMLNELQYDPEIYPEGFIAIFYRNLWAQADLYEALKRYEDAKDKIVQRIDEIKNATDYPHNFKGQMVDDLEWVINLLK